MGAPASERQPPAGIAPRERSETALRKPGEAAFPLRSGGGGFHAPVRPAPRHPGRAPGGHQPGVRGDDQEPGRTAEPRPAGGQQLAGGGRRIPAALDPGKHGAGHGKARDPLTPPGAGHPADPGIGVEPGAGSGVSPTRPGRLFSVPPVDPAAAMRPSPSMATAPTVSAGEAARRRAWCARSRSTSRGTTSSSGRMASNPCSRANSSAPGPASSTCGWTRSPGGRPGRDCGGCAPPPRRRPGGLPHP